MRPMTGGRALLHPRIRCYLNLRTAHLERAHDFGPASIIYAHRKYDFDPELAEGLDVVQAGVAKMAWLIARSRPSVLEVNEPFMWQGLHRTLVAIAAARLSAAVRRSPLRVVSYGIENRDAFATAPTGLRHRLRRWLDTAASRRIARSIDRLAVGTPGSQQLYERRYGRDLRRADVRLVPAVPAACDCGETRGPRGREVLFLGAFDERKGIRELLAAWPHVASARPEATLRVVGKGPLLDEVRERISHLDRVRIDVDPPRPQIHAHLREAAVLVLLSQPRERWREQVGLPMVEALAHGCTVVTTEQSGLAAWLSDHGHFVVDSSSTPDQYAVAVTAALDIGRDRGDVLADLPAVDGRAAADQWLMADVP